MARTPPLGEQKPAPPRLEQAPTSQIVAARTAHQSAAHSIQDSIQRGGTERPQPGMEPPAALSIPKPAAIPSEARSSLSSAHEGVMPKICSSCGVRYPAEFRVCPKDATELVDAESDDDEFIGRTLADTYAILRVIGEGGMGRVYEARHTRIATKRFALKMLHPEYARQPEVLSRFQREAEAAASVRSPYVADVFDIAKTQDGRPFIVAELLDGEELASFVRTRGKLDVELAVRITRQICQALSAAHAKGIVHRDMKPENVFLVGNMQAPIAKVIDFGISKIDEGGKPALTKTGMIMGTPSYMAPEQARGERVDLRVDVYATGAILYELVTGQRPFDRGDPTATITAVLLEDPTRPCALNPELPEALEMVIQRAMAKQADQRYATMDDFEGELSGFAERGNSQTTMAPSATMADKPQRGSRVALEDRQREVSLSRPTIALMSALAGYGVLGGLLTVASSVIRLSRGGGPSDNVTGSEALLLILMMVLGLATPIGFGIHWMRKNIWANSAKTLELASSMRTVVVAVFVTYGVATLSIRLVEAVVLRRAVGVAWPVWDLVAFMFALAAAGAATLAVRRR